MLVLSQTEEFPHVVPRSSFLVPRSSFLVPRSSFLVPRSSFLVPRSSFLVLVGLSILTWTDTALADWPNQQQLVTGTQDQLAPVGGALAVHNTKVFVITEELDPDPNPANAVSRARFRYYECGGGIGDCSSVFQFHTDMTYGATVTYQNLVQPAISARQTSPIGHTQVLMTIRQDWQADCDGDGMTAQMGDVADQKALDLLATIWDTSSPLSSFPSAAPGHSAWATQLVEVNSTTPPCVDHGINENAWDQATAHACYTRIPGPGNDRLSCDFDTTATWQWPNQIDLNRSGDVEDHPSLAFMVTEGRRAVSGTLRVPGTSGTNRNQVRVHFPDHSAPPAEPIVSWDSTTSDDEVDYSSIRSEGGKLHLVWVDGEGNDAQIWYSSCDYGAGADCTNPSNWSQSEVVVDSTTGANHDAQFSQLEVRGNNQFVVYQYSANGDAGDQDWRVMVASRCEGDPTWTVEQVRTPTDSSWDQTVAVGRSHIATSLVDGVVPHVQVLLAELDDYDGKWNFGDTSDGNLHWASKSYSACP